MTDRLTQIQDCLDQLATQFYASIRYIITHHPLPPPPTSTSTSTQSQPPETPGGTGGPGGTSQNPNPTPPQPGHDTAHRPDTPTTFRAAQQELAHDLVLKTKEIETLVKSLPDLSGEGQGSEREQMRRIRELEGELRAVEGVRRGVVGRGREEMLGLLEGVLGSVKRV